MAKQQENMENIRTHIPLFSLYRRQRFLAPCKEECKAFGEIMGDSTVQLYGTGQNRPVFPLQFGEQLRFCGDKIPML